MVAEPTPLGDDARQFLAAEYGTIGAEKNDLLRSVEKDRTFGIIATAAFWSWIGSQPPLTQAQLFLYFLPLGVVILLALKRRAANVVIDQIGNYIRGVEEKVLPKGLGWERHLSTNRKDWFRRLDLGWWITLFIANCGLALIDFFRR